MPEAALLRAGHTHLYPGATLRAATALRAGDEVLIEFSDLGAAAGRVEAVDTGGATLAVQAHRTARGADVAARRWRIEPGAGAAEGTPTWRVRRRIPDQP